MVRSWKAGDYLKMGNRLLFIQCGWRIVFGIITRWDQREPFPSRCHHDAGNDKAASPLLLGVPKVSNTNDMLSRQTCQGITCVPI